MRGLAASRQRQSQLGAVEYLNLALVIDTEYESLVGWIEIGPDDIVKPCPQKEDRSKV